MAPPVRLPPPGGQRYAQDEPQRNNNNNNNHLDRDRDLLGISHRNYASDNRDQRYNPSTSNRQPRPQGSNDISEHQQQARFNGGYGPGRSRGSSIDGVGQYDGAGGGGGQYASSMRSGMSGGESLSSLRIG